MQDIIIKNQTGATQTVGSLIFGATETRNLTDTVGSEALADLSIEPLGKSLVDALNDGDFLLLSPVQSPGAAPGDAVQAASISNVESISAAVVFRGEVANEAQLSSFDNPEAGEYAAVSATATLWLYDGAAWFDTTVEASFQNWIPPVGPPPVPENQGVVTFDLSRTKDVQLQPLTGEVYRIGSTNSGYNVAGLASAETISNPGEYFEFPALVVNQHQGFGLASAADCDGAGPNDNGVPVPGVLWTSGALAYSGRSWAAYFTGAGVWTTGAQNGGPTLTGSGYSNTLLASAGLFSTGAQCRIGLDSQAHAYFGVVVDDVVRVVWRSATPMPVQDYKFVWNGHYITSKLSQLPNRVSAAPPAYEDTHFVRFDGTDEFVSFADSAPIASLLDFTQSWSFGFKLGNTWNPSQSDARDTILRNGANAFYMRGANTGNAAPYLQNGLTYQGQNTWNPLNSGDRVVVTYDSATNRARYFRNGAQVGGGWTLSTLLANNNVDGTCSLAKGGGWSSYLAGGLDEVFFVGRRLLPAEVAESAAGGDPSLWSFYADVIDFLLMGEGTFPSINGIKGALSGTLENGEPEDFVAY